MMPFAMRCYVYAVMTLAIGVVALLPWAGVSLLSLGLLSVLAVGAERVSRVQIASRSVRMSVSLVVTLIAVATLQPPGAAIVGASSGIVLLRNRRELLAGSGLNIAMFTLVPAAGSEVCYLLHGREHDIFLRFPGFFLPYFSAVTTSLVLNLMLVATAASLAKRQTFLGVWRNDLLRATLPYYSSSALALLILVLWHDIGAYTVLLVIVPMYVSHWVLSQYSKEHAAYEATISALVQAVEIKDHYTRGHSERVAKGSELIARRISMPEERLAKLRYAGLLHDVGKLGVPTRLLAKPGKLTDEEYALLCLHPNQGVAVIRDIRFLTEVYDGILYHHERLDGRGYPSGRSGDAIPEFARILGVADAFDAMTSTRSYRAARPVSEAMEELWRGAGTQFDPELVRAFEEALALQEAAGNPWQVTDEPVPAADAALAALSADGPTFSFGDHDDPQVEQEWYPNRIGSGEHLIREGVAGGRGGGSVEPGAEPVADFAELIESAEIVEPVEEPKPKPEPTPSPADGDAEAASARLGDVSQWFVRVERIGRVDQPEGPEAPEELRTSDAPDAQTSPFEPDESRTAGELQPTERAADPATASTADRARSGPPESPQAPPGSPQARDRVVPAQTFESALWHERLVAPDPVAPVDQFVWHDRFAGVDPTTPLRRRERFVPAETVADPTVWIAGFPPVVAPPGHPDRPVQGGPPSDGPTP